MCKHCCVELTGTPFTLRDCLCWFCPEEPWEQEEGEAAESSRQEKAGQPQEEGEGAGGGGGGNPAVAALQSVERDGGVGGEVVNAVGVQGEGARQEGLAGDSSRREDGTVAVAVEGGGMARGARALPRVTVQGVDVPLDDPVIQLWAALRHPDHFLYIVVRRRG